MFAAGPRPRPARRARATLRAAHARRRADDGADGAARRRARGARAAPGRRRGRLPRADRRAATPSTRCTPRCARSAESFGCTECCFRLSLAPAVLERVRGLVGASRRGDRGRGRGRRCRRRRRTVSVHVVEAARGGRPVTVTAVTTAHGGLGPGRRDRVHRGARRRRGAPAGARARSTPRGALPPERCVRPEDLFPELERRSCTFEVEVRARQMKVGVPTEIKPDEYRVSLTPGRRRASWPSTATRCSSRRGAGEGSAIADADYEAQGARIAARRRGRVRRGRDGAGRQGAPAGGGRDAAARPPAVHLPAPGAGPRADARAVRVRRHLHRLRDGGGRARAGCRCWRR